MLYEITEQEFIDIMNKDCYWNLSDEATSYIYEYFEDEKIEDRSFFINTFFDAIEVDEEDIYNENKDKIKSKEDIHKYLENNDEIKIGDCYYCLFGEFKYKNGDVGFILNCI